ncbi:PREDICTED: uncharacterized protein LOC109233159 isoform X2 [Nicotiana attenuata]|uniref:Uncharacterized protein n=1 Tax=Nicotiana attenuata TaxID=49451 RepID=A0A1J6HZU3_NICAT|nr:PREDICTED: uncharacterized protein LOC109233159 isoform X2 [Nicotiana attenuata]OIS97795.1 hypothetical protein A4A49_12914 [Nicotiana attenuata]
MACPSVEIPVFVDTNLGTRIVVVVSPHTTANGFKRELERAHLNCFPQLGQIKADAVMVKRNSCFYRLPETFPLKHVFQHLKGIRSLHVEVCQYGILYQLGSSEYVDDQILDQHDDFISTSSGHTKTRTSMTGTKFEKLKCRRKMKKMKFACLKSALLDVLRIAHLTKMKKKKRNKARKRYKFNCLEGPDEPLVVSKASFALPTYCCEGRGDKEQSFCPAAESHCEDLSEAVSVSGIIKKYFSSHDEVNSSLRYSYEGAHTLQREQTRTRTYLHDLDVELALLSPFPAKTPLQISDAPPPINERISRASINKSKRIEIGTRIISASKSLSSVRCRRLLPKSASLIRSLVFEMSDED